MDTLRVVKLCAIALIGCVGLGLVACNTSRSTVNTMMKFSSSTSPASMLNQDGSFTTNIR